MTNLMVMHSATVTICSCTRTGTRRVQVRVPVLTFQARVHIPDCVVNLSTQCLVECYKKCSRTGSSGAWCCWSRHAWLEWVMSG